MPTYNEEANLPAIAAAILNALPRVTLLVVDDGSPDGTGRLADRLAANALPGLIAPIPRRTRRDP
jgi:dolichol-phosphate mannosyltransferase